MITTLIRAELIKAKRQRDTYFSAYVLVPLCMTILTLALGGDTHPGEHQYKAMTLYHSLIRALCIAGNPLAQLFFSVGAANIFTVDYRYSGWRQMVPRASRLSILAAKMLTFCLLVFFSLILLILGETCANLLMAAVQGTSPVPSMAGGSLAHLLIEGLIVSFAELATLGAVVALIAVATRSMLAAVILPFLFSSAVSFLEYQVGRSSINIPIPTLAADALRNSLGLRNLEAISGNVSFLPALTLLAWFVLTFGLAIALFQRQDLTAE